MDDIKDNIKFKQNGKGEKSIFKRKIRQNEELVGLHQIRQRHWIIRELEIKVHSYGMTLLRSYVQSIHGRLLIKYGMVFILPYIIVIKFSLSFGYN
jgi:hypothetical protein